MNTKPLVSVIIPAYNVASYIEKAIQSVIEQTYPHWELIIINDGSEDHIVDVVQPYLNSNIHLYNQKNQGVSSARNQGLEFSRGEFISFLDADDFYDKDFIKNMLKAILKNNADFAFCKYKKLDSDIVLEQTPEEVVEMPKNSFIEYLQKTKKNAYAVMASVYRKELLRKYNFKFTENTILGEDSEFILKFSMVGIAIFVPDYLYYWVYRSNSASHQELTYQHIRDYLASYDRVLEYLEVADLSRDIKQCYSEYIFKQQNGIRNNFKRLLWNDLKNGRRVEVKKQMASYGKSLQVSSNNMFQAVSNKIKLLIINHCLE